MFAWLTSRRRPQASASGRLRRSSGGRTAGRWNRVWRTAEPLEERRLLTAVPAAEAAASQASDTFGLELYKRLQSSQGGSGNLFLSPVSISTALAMAFAGARGNTAAQIASA